MTASLPPPSAISSHEQQLQQKRTIGHQVIRHDPCSATSAKVGAMHQLDWWSQVRGGIFGDL